MSPAGRLLALDIGAVRTGIALSDELRLTARALETVPTTDLHDRLADRLAEFEVTTVVVGRPRSLDGSLGAQVEFTERTVQELRTLPAEFIYEDETGTSPADGDDAAAARVILEGYLREHHA